MPAAASALVDTGFLLAVLDAEDHCHEPCVEELARARFPLATSAAVLTELFYLVGTRLSDLAATWTLVRSGAITVLPVDERDFGRLEALMKRYADRPMDFTDATLVHLARRESLTTVLTVDNDDFETYRIEGKRRFQVRPGRVALNR